MERNSGGGKTEDWVEILQIQRSSKGPVLIKTEECLLTGQLSTMEFSGTVWFTVSPTLTDFILFFSVDFHSSNFLIFFFNVYIFFSFCQKVLRGNIRIWKEWVVPTGSGRYLFVSYELLLDLDTRWNLFSLKEVVLLIFFFFFFCK